MKTWVLVLGAGFGGLEVATMLSEALGDEVDVILIDKNDGTDPRSRSRGRLRG